MHVHRSFFVALILAWAALMSPAAVMAQDEVVAVSRIEAAMTTGDASALAAQAAERVELTLFGAASMYSRAQAVYVLAEFFREHAPHDVEIDPPTRSGDNCFALGRYYVEGNESPLRVFLRLRDKLGEWQIREIRIERLGGGS